MDASKRKMELLNRRGRYYALFINSAILKHYTVLVDARILNIFFNSHVLGYKEQLLDGNLHMILVISSTVNSLNHSKIISADNWEVEQPFFFFLMQKLFRGLFLAIQFVPQVSNFFVKELGKLICSILDWGHTLYRAVSH